MTCPHTGYIETDQDYLDADEPFTAAGRAAKARWEREHPEDIYCQHDHASCDPSQPLGLTTEFRCTSCSRPFCEHHVLAERFGGGETDYWCAECVAGMLECGEFQDTDARRWLAGFEKEAA